MTSLKMLLWMTVLTGWIYTGFITVIAQIFLHQQASGSIIYVDKVAKGSALIGQPFTKAIYFWPRPSATDYSALPSGASNLGPTSIVLKNQVAQRRLILAGAHEIQRQGQVPLSLLFASASGLDPHITLEAALFQVDRVAKARGISADKLQAVVEKHIERRWGGMLGKIRVNVLLLNIAVDDLFQASTSSNKPQPLNLDL